jgi:hypothetical protein
MHANKLELLTRKPACNHNNIYYKVQSILINRLCKYSKHHVNVTYYTGKSLTGVQKRTCIVTIFILSTKCRLDTN